MQTETLASIISVVFVVFSHHKHPKYLTREFNHGYCLSHNFFMEIASVTFFLAVALEGDS